MKTLFNDRKIRVESSFGDIRIDLQEIEDNGEVGTEVFAYLTVKQARKLAVKLLVASVEAEIEVVA